MPQPRLTDKYAHCTSGECRERGQALFEHGCVRIHEAGVDHLLAEVDGEPFCEVRAQIAGKILELECECGGGSANALCKHLWALLCAADRGDDLARARKRSVRKDPRLLTQTDPGDSPQTEEPTGEISSLAAETSLPETICFPPNQEAPPAELEIAYALRVADSAENEQWLLETFWRPATERESTSHWRVYIPEIGRTLEQAPDAKILEVLAHDYLAPTASSYLPGCAHAPNVFALSDRTVKNALPLAARSGRLFLHTGVGPTAQPLQWDGESAWNLALSFEAGTSGLLPLLSFHRGDEILHANEVQAIHAAGFLLAGQRLSRLEDHGATPFLHHLIGCNSMEETGFGETTEMIRKLALETDLPLHQLPEDLRFERVQATPTGRLHIRTAKYKFRGTEQLHAELSFDYEGAVCREQGKDARLPLPQRRAVVSRDPADEEVLREVLREMGFRYNTKVSTEELGWKLQPSRLDDSVRQLVEAGWLVTAQGKTYRKPQEKTATLSTHTDWFELDAGIDYGGIRATLPELLKALQSGATAVRLDDGTHGLLPEEWLRNYTVLSEIGVTEGGKILFRRSQAALLESLLEAREVRTDDDFAPVCERIRGQLGSEPLAAPPGFVGTLRAYQCDGLGWMAALARAELGGCLADDMGLGKTVQILALLEIRRQDAVDGPSLVVMPSSLIFNWREEAARFAPQLAVHVYAGASRRRGVNAFQKANLVLTTYGTLRNDIGMLARIPFDYCILDESQAIKNPGSQTAKAVGLIQASHRLTLTGTPIENHLGDLLSQLHFLNPGLLGGSAFLRRLAAKPDSLATEDRQALAKAIRPLVLRRTKQQVAKDLPPKTEQTLYCEMEAPELQEYEELRGHYRARLLDEDSDGPPVEALEALLRLRQLACHPGLIDPDRQSQDSAKTSVLFQRLEEAVQEGHKALVFSQFTSLLHIVRTRLEHLRIPHCYLDGKTRDRQAEVERFQNDEEVPVFLISLKAGGVGLNLTAADYVFLLDPWWNPAIEAQAMDRAYRIGQTRAVFAYKLITRNTVEEKVLTLQKRKQELASSIIGSQSLDSRTLNLDDLSFLLDG